MLKQPSVRQKQWANCVAELAACPAVQGTCPVRLQLFVSCLSCVLLPLWWWVRQRNFEISAQAGKEEAGKELGTSVLASEIMSNRVCLGCHDFHGDLTHVYEV